MLLAPTYTNVGVSDILTEDHLSKAVSLGVRCLLLFSVFFLFYGLLFITNLSPHTKPIVQRRVLIKSQS